MDVCHLFRQSGEPWTMITIIFWGRIVSGSKTCGQVIEDFNALMQLVSTLHKGFAVETIQNWWKRSWERETQD